MINFLRWALIWLLCQDGETQDEELQEVDRIEQLRDKIMVLQDEPEDAGRELRYELVEVARRKLLELGHPNCRCVLAPSYFRDALAFVDFINNELEFTED
jgi:hypothetical protein